MPLHIASLNSGSNGNCYYIGNGQDAVLIDAGISCRETETRMKRLQLPMQTVKAIFVSHEHSDHIQGLAVLSRKYSLPVHITEATLRGCGSVFIEKNRVSPLASLQETRVGSLRITAFPKWHDAAEPHSFLVHDGEVTIGVFTDIGSPCEHVVHHFKQCHAAFLEANYDDVMLDQGKYPIHLKRRISGKHGHLSNKQALDLFVKHKPPFMSHLLLSHLSKENNHPQLVQDLFTQHANGTKIVVASRYKESEVYEVSSNGKTTPVSKTSSTSKPSSRHQRPEQLSLF